MAGAKLRPTRAVPAGNRRFTRLRRAAERRGRRRKLSAEEKARTTGSEVPRSEVGVQEATRTRGQTTVEVGRRSEAAGRRRRSLASTERLRQMKRGEGTGAEWPIGEQSARQESERPKGRTCGREAIASGRTEERQAAGGGKRPKRSERPKERGERL